MEIVTRGRVKIGIIPVVHGRNDGGFGSIDELKSCLDNFRPKIVCIEASDSELSRGCHDELAEAVCYKRAVGVDIPQISTRRRLSQRLLLHPIQGYRLFRSRTPNITCMRDAVSWRKALELENPIAFETLYRDREKAMAAAVALSIDDEVRCRLNDNGSEELRVALVAGAGHCSGLAEILTVLDLHAVDINAAVVRDAHQTPVSATPLIFLLYLFIPFCLFGPWPYAVAWFLKPGNSNGQVCETKG